MAQLEWIHNGDASIALQGSLRTSWPQVAARNIESPWAIEVA